MANYANQKTIRLHNQDVISHKENDNKRFLKATNWEFLEAAGRHLKGENFKVYMYFLSWYGKDRIDFSPTEISERWGIGVSTARGAITTLIDKGFLVPVDGHPNTYDFYPISQTCV